MTIDHPLRRVLAHVCSADTMARIVDPTLADIRWEAGRPAWLGYLAVAKALLFHTALSTPGILYRVWSDDDRAIPKVAGLALVGAAVGAMLLEIPFFREPAPNRDASAIGIGLLLAPQALILSLPAALLLAIPLAFRRQAPSGRLARRTIALSLGCVAATFVLVLWIVPESNQAFRVLTYGHDLPRGPSEQGLAAMRERIEALKLTPVGRIAARRAEFDYQIRLVLPCLPLPLGVVALAIARTARGRRRPWVMGLAALAGYVLGFFPILVGAGTLVRGSALPPSLFAWTPIALLAIAAFRAYSSASALPDSAAVS